MNVIKEEEGYRGIRISDGTVMSPSVYNPLKVDKSGEVVVVPPEGDALYIRNNWGKITVTRLPRGNVSTSWGIGSANSNQLYGREKQEVTGVTKEVLQRLTGESKSDVSRTLEAWKKIGEENIVNALRVIAQ